MQSSSKSGDEFSVYVRNLDPSTPPAELEELLYELFLQAGPLCRVHLPYDRSTGVHRGYGDQAPGPSPERSEPAGGQQNNAVTPSTPVGGTGVRNGDSPSAAAPSNPFQQALDHSHPMHAMPSPFTPADLRSPSADLVQSHHYSPMESPRGYPAPRGYPHVESSHGYPPMESHGFPPMELERSHHRHHESRLHSRDHPHWLKEDVRDRLSRYHQHELEREPHSRRSSHDEQSSYDRQSSHEGIHRRSSYEDSHRRSSHEGSHKHYH
ncbi:hypothetical protein EMCRGX_G015780 [Ephydatia muelleri]